MNNITTISASSLAGTSNVESVNVINPSLNMHYRWKGLSEETILPKNVESNKNIFTDYFTIPQTPLSSPGYFSPSANKQLEQFHPEKKQLEEIIFDATSSVKIAMSQVAMHVDRQFRDKLFRQIDSMHELDEWDEDDNPINKDSFVSFIKCILQIKPQRHPGLGLSHSGNLIAAWIREKNRLIVEFLPNGRTEWVVSRYFDDELDRITGKTSVSRLYDQLAPFHPEVWFNK